jgi:hypothetical protein
MNKNYKNISGCDGVVGFMVWNEKEKIKLKCKSIYTFL